MATLEVDVVIPIRCVQQHALVFVDARNGRPLPIVQNTRGIHENVAMILNNLTTFKILDVHIVSALLLVPVCANYLMPRLDEFVQAVLAREVVEVGKDLSRAGVNRRPVELRLKRPSVVVRRYIASAPAAERS